MSDNPSFVLKGIDDVVYEQRPIPEGESIGTSSHRFAEDLPVTGNQVLVEVKKTGEYVWY